MYFLPLGAVSWTERSDILRDVLPNELKGDVLDLAGMVVQPVVIELELPRWRGECCSNSNGREH